MNTVFELAFISKYLHISKRFYLSFIDLRKAFDNVLHPALTIQLVSCGLGGKVLSVIEALYPQLIFRLSVILVV